MRINFTVKRVSVWSIWLAIIVFATVIYAQSNVFQKPSVLPHGTFAPKNTRRARNEVASENGRFWCRYGVEVVTDMACELKNLEFYENNALLFKLKYVPGLDVTISNSGFMAFSKLQYKESGELTINFFSKNGNKLFSKKFEKASLFGFSPAGNKYGVGSHGKFEIFSLPSRKTETYPNAHQFDISIDETMVSLACDDGVHLYSNEKLIYRIKTELFYNWVRKVKISPDNKYVVFIGKKKLFVYSIPECRLIFSDKLKENNSFCDIQLNNTTLWAGIHYRNREKRESTGILKTYDLNGDVISEEVEAVRQFPPLEKLNYQYKKDEVPWPFKPFDEANDAWNSYLQLIASDDGNNSRAYLHQGFDMDVPSYAECYAVADGYVKARLTTGGNVYWRVSISDVETSAKSDGWLYAHLVESSIAVIVGDEVKQGDFVAEIVPWPGLPGGHIHFSRIEGEGTTWSSWRNVANPMFFLRPHGDTEPPEIQNVLNDSKFGFTDNDNTSDYLEPDDLSGEIDILVKVRDICGVSPWVQAATTIYYWVKYIKSGKIVFPRTLAYWRGQDMPDYSGNLYFTLQDVIWRVNSKFPVKGWFTKERLYVHVITNNDGDSVITKDEDDLAFNTKNYGDGDYRIVVEVQDAAGNTTIDSQDVYFNNDISGNISGNENSVTDFYLSQNYPGRGGASMNINFHLPKPAQVSLKIFDLSGSEIKTLASGTYSSGKHTVMWNGTNNTAQQVNSGMYLYKLKAGMFSAVKKMVYSK